MSAPLKQNQGPTIAMILEEPRTQDNDVVFITHVGATKGEDGPHPQIQMAGRRRYSLVSTLK